jgi:hypothetical protein
VTINLTGAAPAGGFNVALSSSDPTIVVPSTATVPAGATLVVVSLQHSQVSADKNVTITATAGVTTKTAVYLVKAYTLKTFTLNKTTILGGTDLKAVITLSAPAPAAGFTVALSSNTGALVPPATVNVPAGISTVSAVVSTQPVAVDTAGTVTATAGSSVKTASTTVLRPVLTSLTVTPTSVVGGSTTVVKAKVVLNGPAPAGGMTVTLSSSNSGAAGVPVSVVIPAGALTAVVTVDHKVVGTPTTVTISGTLNGVTKSGTLTVNP